MKFNHNTMAVLFPFLTIVALGAFVLAVPEVGIAPEETALKVLLRVAIFYACWPLALRAFGGWDYSITKAAKKTLYGMPLLAMAIIIGTALVISR